MLGFGQFIQEGNYVQSSVLQYTEPRHCGEDQKQRNVRLSAKLKSVIGQYSLLCLLANPTKYHILICTMQNQTFWTVLPISRILTQGTAVIMKE